MAKRAKRLQLVRRWDISAITTHDNDAGDTGVVFLKHYMDEFTPDEEIYPNGLEAIQKAGQEPDIIIGDFVADENYFYLTVILGSEKERHLRIFTKTGELHADFPNVIAFDIDKQSGVYVSKLQESGIKKYNIKTQKEEFSVEGNPKVEKIALDEMNDLIYAKTNTEIITYNMTDGKLNSSVLEIAKDAPSISSSVKQIKIGIDGGIYLMAQSENYTKIWYKYSLVDDARKDMQYTLTVTAPYRDEYFSKVIVWTNVNKVDRKKRKRIKKHM